MTDTKKDETPDVAQRLEELAANLKTQFGLSEENATTFDDAVKALKGGK